MRIELRWVKEDGDYGDYKLQYRVQYHDAYYENWQEVPFVLERAENPGESCPGGSEDKS